MLLPQHNRSNVVSQTPECRTNVVSDISKRRQQNGAEANFSDSHLTRDAITMPTFRSIPIHPTLQEKLAQSSERDGGVPITTPQALLSRTPAALAQQLLTTTSSHVQRQALLEEIGQVRRDVAYAMIQQSHSGKRRRLMSSRNPREAATCQDCLEGISTNVLDMLATETHDDLSPLPRWLTTGSRALDNKIAFPKHSWTAVGQSPTTDTSTPTHNPLTGAVPRGHVLTITGLSGSGKTQLALQIAIRFALQNQRMGVQSCTHGGGVRYLYSTMGHSALTLAQRSVQLYRHANPHSKTIPPRQLEFQPISTRIQLISALSTLENSFDDNEIDRPNLIVVDSFSSLLSDHIHGSEDDVQQVDRLLRWLKRLARENQVWVIVVGQEGAKGTKCVGSVADVHLLCAPAPSRQWSLLPDQESREDDENGPDDDMSGNRKEHPPATTAVSASTSLVVYVEVIKHVARLVASERKPKDRVALLCTSSGLVDKPAAL